MGLCARDSELLPIHVLGRAFSPKTESSYRAFLKFVPSNDDLSGEDDIPVLDVARLLAKRGVRYAIMNACQSASEEGPVSSAARTMINEGLLVAIGMRYQVLDSAVDIFVKNFYHHYMQKGEAFIGAAHIGRHALQLQPNRRTKFNTDVQVTDYVTPIVAVSTELDICHLCLNHTDSTLAHVLGKRVDIWGREGDILSLETKTAISTVLLIRASAGTGKTFLARHLCWWWKATGFVEDSVVIDCATVGGLGVQHIREKIDIGFGISSKHGSIDTETYLKRHKCLIVLDSLDAAQVDRESSSSQRALRSFLRRIKNCENSIVLLLSRYEERWVQTIANVIYHLNNLDMKASLQLATQEATASSPNNRLSDRLDSRFLEQCMSLVDGNALAISILMKEYHTTCDSFRSLYHKLTNGSVLNGYGQDDCEEDCQRGVIDARSIIRLHIGDSQAGFMRDDDFRLLAPFWYSFPANLAYYRMFYQLAKARVTYDNQIPELPNSWLKALIEGFSAREFDVAAEGKEFPASKISSLRSLEPTFRLCEEKGFLYRSNDSSLRIHPLMTLVLRSQPFALPEWAAHVIKVAFLRFVSYQKRHWPTGNNFVQDPKIRKTLDATFANYATACNFSLAIKPDFLMNCITFDIITFSIHHTERRALIVLDVCDRFLEVFGLPLARNGQSTAQNTFSGMGSNDIFADVRGKLEMCCLGAILCADTAAEMLDVQHNHLDLLEGIAENLRRHSELYDVNLEILAAARIRLARHTVGDQYIESDLERILKVADAVDAESGRILRAEAGLVGYDLAERVAKIEAPDEIDALEQELLRLLERQLDGIDAAESKVVIYEMLAVLDLKREKYEDASRHIDTAMEIFRPFRHNQPKRWQLLVDEREKMMAAKVFLAMLQVITSFNVTHTPPKDTES